jgi:transcriptional regulator with XRE-family HTH domain
MMNCEGEEGKLAADDREAQQPKSVPLRSLADKVNWLIDNAHPAGRGPLSNAEVAALVEKVTGEKVSYTTIWKLRNGQATNPQMRLIEALARTFSVPPAFFFEDFDEERTGMLRAQIELLAMVRDAGITNIEMRTILELSPEARKSMIELIQRVARSEAERRQRGDGEEG